MRLRLDGLDWHEYDALHTPHVPVLCLTSPDDLVITTAAVRDWADCLRARSDGQRDVRIETAESGNHCLLLQSRSAWYTAAIDGFVAATGVADSAALIQVARDAAAAEAACEASALASVLEAAGVGHLAKLFGALDLDEAFALHEQGRPVLLAKLKALGVASLGERQKAANAIGKASREHGGPRQRAPVELS